LFNLENKSIYISNDIATDLDVVYGRFTKKFSDSVNVSVNGEVRNFSTANAYVYEYNSARQTNNVNVVTAGDIEVFEEGNEVRLFIKISEDEVTEMVIIR